MKDSFLIGNNLVCPQRREEGRGLGIGFQCVFTQDVSSAFLDPSSKTRDLLYLEKKKKLDVTKEFCRKHGKPE